MATSALHWPALTPLAPTSFGGRFVWKSPAVIGKSGNSCCPRRIPRCRGYPTRVSRGVNGSSQISGVQRRRAGGVRRADEGRPCIGFAGGLIWIDAPAHIRWGPEIVQPCATRFLQACASIVLSITLRQFGRSGRLIPSLAPASLWRRQSRSAGLSRGHRAVRGHPTNRPPRYASVPLSPELSGYHVPANNSACRHTSHRCT